MPPPGNPAAGAGGQKAAGTAVPGKRRQRPGANQPLTNQPLTKQPGQAPRPLNLAQHNQVQNAAQKGTLDQYLANHPGVAKHYGRVQASGTSGQKAHYATLQQKNTAAKAGTGAPGGGKGGAAAPQPAPTAPGNPGGAPADAGGVVGGNTGGAPTPPAAPTTFADAFNAQYGAGAANQFGPAPWTGPDPIQ